MNIIFLGAQYMFPNSKKDFRVIGLSIIVNFIISFITYFIDKPFWFNENQLLYIFATIAQITGSLLGLTLAAYTLIDDKFKKIGDSEESSLDYANQIRAENFDNLISISILSIFTIILSLLVLLIYRNKHLEITIFFMLESIYIFIRLLIKIYIFIQDANPNNIIIKKEKEKELFDSEYTTNHTMEEKSFASFITYYNVLEEAIKNYAQKQLPEKNNNINLQFLDSLSILRDLDIISQKCYAQINELRLYRNSLVHSTEDNKIVNSTLFEILKNICNLFLSLTESSDNDNLYSEAKIKLDNYVDSLASNIDEKLLCFLIKHPGATLQDITDSLNITVSATKRKLQKLIIYGYVTKQDNNKHITFHPDSSLPEINGSFSFDYSNNNGVYIIGDNEWKFSTKWSKGSDKIIHAYSDSDDIDCIARIKNVSNISNMQKDILLKQDYSSRCRDIGIGDVAIWKNIHGHYLLTLVKQIQDDTRDHDSDLLECEYKIIL